MANDYLMSYTAAGLMYPESLAIVDAYLKTYDWEKTREQILTENLLQKRNPASMKRQRQELVKRLKTLTDNELSDLIAADPETQRKWLWTAICRTYPFINELNSELLPEKAHSSDPFITTADIRNFYDQKSLDHPALRDYTETTREKLITTAMRLMKQAEVLGEGGEIKI